jgi:hypothetical protein
MMVDACGKFFILVMQELGSGWEGEDWCDSEEWRRR